MSPGQATAGSSGRLVLVFNSGSSSVKFALLLAGSGERLMGGMGERLGTPEASLRVQWFPAAAVEEQLGLKLEPRRDRMDVVVVDHIERPTPD